MSNYTLNTANLFQIDGTALVNNEIVLNGGTVSGLGSVSTDSPVSAKVDFGQADSGKDIYGSRLLVVDDVYSIFSNTISNDSTSDQSGSLGVEAVAHGLAVGDKVRITGTGTAAYDTVHTVATVTDVDNYITSTTWGGSPSSDGSTVVVSGRFASMTANEYIMRGGVTQDVANLGAKTKTFGSEGTRRSIHFIEGFDSYLVTTAIRAGNYDVYSGTFTTAPSSSTDSFGQDHAARPTYAIPGELVYRTSGQKTSGIEQDDYSAKTGG